MQWSKEPLRSKFALGVDSENTSCPLASGMTHSWRTLTEGNNTKFSVHLLSQSEKVDLVINFQASQGRLSPSHPGLSGTGLQVGWQSRSKAQPRWKTCIPFTASTQRIQSHWPRRKTPSCNHRISAKEVLPISNIWIWQSSLHSFNRSFLFAMRSCEYIKVQGTRKTKLLELRNIRFFEFFRSGTQKMKPSPNTNQAISYYAQWKFGLPS
jgi:hypothetical protein